MHKNAAKRVDFVFDSNCDRCRNLSRHHLMLKLYARTSAGLLFLFTNCREHKMHFVISWRAPSVLGLLLSCPHLAYPLLAPCARQSVCPLCCSGNQRLGWRRTSTSSCFLKFNSHDEAHQRAGPAIESFAQPLNQVEDCLARGLGRGVRGRG